MAVSARFPVVLQPLLGAVSGLAGVWLMTRFAPEPGAVAAIALWTAWTLGSGERGFARWFPKLPLFGTLLAACTLLLRWYALVSLEKTPIMHLYMVVIAAATIGPASSVALGWISRPVDPAAFRQLSVLTTIQAVIAITTGVAAALACGVRLGAVLVLVVYLLLRLGSGLAQWRYGGVRGSDLEAFRVVVETMTLVLASSLRDL